MNDLSSVWVVAGLLGVDLSIDLAEHGAVCSVARDIAQHRERLAKPYRAIRGDGAAGDVRKLDRMLVTVGNLTGYFQ